MEIKLPKLKKINPDTSSKKKKILLLSDDLRMFSGIGTMSREFVSICNINSNQGFSYAVKELGKKYLKVNQKRVWKNI